MFEELPKKFLPFCPFVQQFCGLNREDKRMKWYLQTKTWYLTSFITLAGMTLSPWRTNTLQHVKMNLISRTDPCRQYKTYTCKISNCCINGLLHHQTPRFQVPKCRYVKIASCRSRQKKCILSSLLITKYLSSVQMHGCVFPCTGRKWSVSLPYSCDSPHSE